MKPQNDRVVNTDMPEVTIIAKHNDLMKSAYISTYTRTQYAINTKCKRMLKQHK